MVKLQACVFLLCCVMVHGLDNGLARTPPMGWLSWERFRCNTDCVNDPDNCISENLFKTMAKLMAMEGYKDVGYQYVNIDDCWPAKTRDNQGRLQADPDRFPSGIKTLADYVHGLGLKLGIYEDFGTHTCGGFPGLEYYEQMDTQTFAEWQVDFLKLDGCYSDPKQYDDAYPIVGSWLNRTGRPILYSCSWPAYQEGSKMVPNYTHIAQSCNIWRNYGDVADSWDSVASIIEFYGNDNTHFAQVAGPGSFNDPDMLILGNFGLSYDQERVQMAMWSILAAPLIMSVDLRTIRNESKALLQNKHVIAINQDPLGKQGTRLFKMGDIQVWTKPVLPKGSWAVAYYNVGTGGTPSKVSVKLSDMKITGVTNYQVVEVFEQKSLGKLSPSQPLVATVNPTGIFLAKVTPL